MHVASFLWGKLVRAAQGRQWVKPAMAIKSIEF